MVCRNPIEAISWTSRRRAHVASLIRASGRRTSLQDSKRSNVGRLSPNHRGHVASLVLASVRVPNECACCRIECSWVEFTLPKCDGVVALLARRSDASFSRPCRNPPLDCSEAEFTSCCSLPLRNRSQMRYIGRNWGPRVFGKLLVSNHQGYRHLWHQRDRS